MSTTVKVIYLLLAIFAVGLGVEGYFYFQKVTKSTPATPLTSTNSQQNISRAEVKSSVAAIGFINLFEITKTQVAEWAKASGPVEVPAYSGPTPSPPPGVIYPTAPPSVKVIAGYFKRGNPITGIVISQGGGKETTLLLGQKVYLWIKEGNKLEIVSTTLNSLLSSPNASGASLIDLNDLVLIPNVEEKSGSLSFVSMIIFK